MNTAPYSGPNWERVLWSSLVIRGGAIYQLRYYTKAISRPAFRYFGAVIPSVFNVFSLQGFLILNCIIGGQTLASVSSHLNDTLGIVIIGVISLVVRNRSLVIIFI